MILNLICLSFIFIVLIIAAIDVSPIFGDWLARIHIGKYSDKYIWEKSIEKVSSKWLLKIPKIKVTDNTRLIFIDMIMGNYVKESIQHWQEAALILGVNEYLKNNNDAKINRNLNKFLKNKFNNEGNWKKKPVNIDCAILSYALLNSKNINVDKYKPSLDYTWNLIKEHIGEDGTMLYRKSIKDYRYVDTIGLVCPFLVKYGIKYNDEESIDLAIRQLTTYKKYGMGEKYKIPYHGYKVDENIPLGLYGWGRGVGWYAIGLIDCFNELPKNHKYKELLTESIIAFSKDIIKFQQENGAWGWTVTRSEVIRDSSTVAALGWFLINAAKILAIEKQCKESVEKAINYLMSVTRRSGVIDFSQGDTKDIGVYSMLFNILPFTQGFALRTISLFLEKS